MAPNLLATIRVRLKTVMRHIKCPEEAHLIHLEPARLVRDVKLKSLFVHFQPKRKIVLRRNFRRVRDSATVCQGRFLRLQCGGQRFTSHQEQYACHPSQRQRISQDKRTFARLGQKADVGHRPLPFKAWPNAEPASRLARLGGRAELATSFKQMTLQNCTCSVDIPISASL